MSDAKAFLKKNLRFLIEKFVTKSRLHAVERINSSFVLIEIRGAETANWNPGDKIQIEVGNYRDRTYTPFDVDRANGSLKILCFKRSSSPASDWLDEVKSGDACEFVGPRSSLKLTEAAPIVLFGDETTIGLALALKSIAPSLRVVLEGRSASEINQTLSRVGLVADVVQVSDDESHLLRISSELAPIERATFVLAGRARAIQIVRAELLKKGISASRLKTKVYWADGKAGLD